MSEREIRKFGDPVLRQKAKKIPRVNNAVRKILDEMLDIMRNNSGAGLAAPQIGISKRLAVVDVGEGPYFLVNPEIVARSADTDTIWEGCLSWPGYVGEVQRPQKVSIRALDRDGHEVWVEAEGFLARAFQHELDHLDGVLFVDRASLVKEVTKEDEGEEEGEGNASPVKAVFMGSPEFSVPSLEELTNCGVDVRLVVTQPDRPQGRKQTVTPTPVKRAALRLGLPVLECSSLMQPEVLEAIRKESPDFIIVVAFGQMVPAAILEAPKFACLNLHPSLLPKYRGGNPIQRVVMAGDTVTGVSIIYMSEGMDAGDICVQRQLNIGPDETYGTLEKRLSSFGAHVLADAISLVLSGEAPRIPQDDTKMTLARHLKKGEEIINWRAPAVLVHALVRGLTPRPGAVTLYEGNRIKILETRITASKSQEKPGAILEVTGDSGFVSCGDGVIEVVSVQPEGKKPMPFRAFLAGRAQGKRMFQNGNALKEG